MKLINNPREKALLYGLNQLTDSELIALFLRTGHKKQDVLSLANHLLKEVGGLQDFQYLTYGKLTSIKGIKQAKAMQILAAIELSKRMITPKMNQIQFTNPQSIYQYMKEKVKTLSQENFYLLVLNNKNGLIKEKILFINDW